MNLSIHFTLAAILLATSMAAPAQPPGPPPGPPPPEQVVEHLTAELQLTETQQAALWEILQAAAPDRRADRPRCASPEQRDARRDAVDAEIAALLDEDQRTRFEALRANRPAPPPRGAMRQQGTCG